MGNTTRNYFWNEVKIDITEIQKNLINSKIDIMKILLL